MYNVAILLPSLDYRNNTNGAINRASMGILWEQISWLIAVFLAVTFSICSIESRYVWCLCFLPPILYDFSVVLMGIGVLRLTISWCLLSDVVIRIVHIIGLLSRGFSLLMLISYAIIGTPDLEVPLALITGAVIFQVLFASLSSSLRCPWVILRFLFIDIWIGLLLFQIFLRISSESKYYREISKDHFTWETSSQFHGNLTSIAEKFQQIPSWWVVFWPCWFWCGVIFSFSTVFCVLGVADKMLAIFGVFLGCLSTTILITCLDLADFLNETIYLKENKYAVSYHVYEQNSHIRLWHICIICTQTMIAVMSAVISQGLIQESDEGFSLSSADDHFITSNIKQFKKMISPYKIGSEVILTKMGTGVFHKIENQSNNTLSQAYSDSKELISCEATSTHTLSTVNSPTSNNSLSPVLSYTPKSKRESFSDSNCTLTPYDDNHEQLCIICCDNNCESVFLPCGHGGLCSNCALREFYRIGLCPTCRQATSAIATYKSQRRKYNHSRKINAVIIATQDL
ncbi:Zinc finger, C3HC4 type (RING finger) family protein [Cryptosporidium meleagridis]|uniref:Zinc finger, C3HC4 type (RING finger) family protein n=1 Tax=Cryptosporidium meleagridis TaxID=93969 RepID=A0A2P4Z2B2_9CRYT|nr:Zinc finger, C3HC4 type (RING finger) family protein [Cryptosporidium meleagridis]